MLQRLLTAAEKYKKRQVHRFRWVRCIAKRPISNCPVLASTILLSKFSGIWTHWHWLVFNVWWSRYPAGYNALVNIPHTHTRHTKVPFPSVWLPAERVHTPSWQPMDSFTHYITLSQIHPDHTYYMHCLIYVAWSMFVWCYQSCWWRWRNRAIECQPLMTSLLPIATLSHCAQNRAKPLLNRLKTDKCKRKTTVIYIIGFILFLLCWNEVLCL